MPRRVLPKADVYALRERLLKCFANVRDGHLRFDGDRGRNINALVEPLLQTLNGHQRWYEIGSVLLHHVEGFIVEKSSVFNRIHARADSALCGLGAVAMRSNFQS